MNDISPNDKKDAAWVSIETPFDAHWLGEFLSDIERLYRINSQLVFEEIRQIGDDSYLLKAGFENIGGLKVRSPVTVSGVRVGRVVAIDYDDEAFEAVVTLRIESRHDGFPQDTSASIFTAGLLGEQYIALEPGGAMDNLVDGDRLQLTQSALVMEQIIGQFLYSTTASKQEE